jgi:hypothetical protein
MSGGRKVEFRSTNLPPSSAVEESYLRLATFITKFDPMHLALMTEENKSPRTGHESDAESKALEAKKRTMKEGWENEIERTQWLSGIKKLMDAASRVIALLQLGDPVLSPIENPTCRDATLNACATGGAAGGRGERVGPTGRMPCSGLYS